MKYLKYTLYLIKHKWFVALACFRMGLIWRGFVHDISKFYPSEFLAYANYFYARPPCMGARLTKILDKFDRAWLRHQHRNKHHWQHWVLLNDNGTMVVLPMTKKYVYEMVADWIGAGRAIKGRGIPKDEVVDWYISNRPIMTLHPETEDKIVYLLSKKFGLSDVALFQGVKRPASMHPGAGLIKEKNMGGIVTGGVPSEFTGKPHPPMHIDTAKGDDRTGVISYPPEASEEAKKSNILISSKNNARKKV